MNIWHDISPKVITKEKFTAVIEIPKGSKVKYELDKTTGLLRMDRILYTSTHYPANYGFIPRTYAEDGDPLDVLVLCSETLAPLSLVDCYPIGVISMLDNGAADEKIICIPLNDPTYNIYKDISELPKHIFDEMCHFFSVYKALEHKDTVVDDVKDREHATEIVAQCIDRYIENFCKQITEAWRTHRGASAFLLHIVFLPLQLPFLPLYFAVLCNFTIIFGCFNVKNPLSCSIPLQTLFSLSKQ